MPRDLYKDTSQHMPEEATPETEDDREGRKDTGPREEPMSEQVAGAPDPEVRDTPLKADRESRRENRERARTRKEE